MPYKGHVKNGVIVLDAPVALEEGTEVAVEVVHVCQESGDGDKKARFERYEPLIGALDNMPADWSESHDKYLREQHRT
jgi:hypothetical protein